MRDIKFRRQSLIEKNMKLNMCLLLVPSWGQIPFVKNNLSKLSINPKAEDDEWAKQ